LRERPFPSCLSGILLPMIGPLGLFSSQRLDTNPLLTTLAFFLHDGLVCSLDIFPHWPGDRPLTAPLLWFVAAQEFFGPILVFFSFPLLHSIFSFPPALTTDRKKSFFVILGGCRDLEAHSIRRSPRSSIFPLRLTDIKRQPFQISVLYFLPRYSSFRFSLQN